MKSASANLLHSPHLIKEAIPAVQTVGIAGMKLTARIAA